MSVMTIRAGLDDRKVCGQTLELIAIRECEHLQLRICLHFFQRIRFGLGFRKVGSSKSLSSAPAAFTNCAGSMIA